MDWGAVAGAEDDESFECINTNGLECTKVVLLNQGMEMLHVYNIL